MTTFAADEHTSAVRDERERAAWAHYADTLRELGPVSYAVAEPPAWEHLQETLAEIVAAAPDGAVDGPRP